MSKKPFYPVKTKHVERTEEKQNETYISVFSLKNKTILAKVQIINIDLDMQIDTESEVTLIPRNFGSI